MSEILVANNNSVKFRDKVEELVGKPFSIWQRMRMNGNGSGRIEVAAYSPQLVKCFGENSGRKHAIIELRPKGIAIYIRNPINDYVWCIPYRSLSIFQSNLYSIHSKGNYIKIDLNKSLKVTKSFFKKMFQEKTKFTENQSVIQ